MSNTNGPVSDVIGNAKAWWKSKTIIGTILMFIPTILKLINPELDVDAQGAIDEVWIGAEGVATYLDSIWSTLQVGLGFVLAVYGRIKAKVGIKGAST